MTDYSKEETEANRAKWVAALRSDEFKQARGGLTRDDKGTVGYCCLGVACEVALREGAIPEYDRGLLVLPEDVTEWLGLGDAAGSTTEEIEGENGYQAPSLWELNDVARMPFRGIADVIEAGKVALA